MGQEQEGENSGGQQGHNRQNQVEVFIRNIPGQFDTGFFLFGRGEPPVKIIAADCTAKYKAGQFKRKGKAKKKPYLPGHDHGATCNEQAGKNKKVK